MALGLKDNPFCDRIFRLFDENNDGVISWAEFICGLSIFSKHGTFDEKLRFSFNIYDVDGDGYIDRSELFRMVRAVLLDSSSGDMGLTVEQIHTAVDATFSETDTNCDGRISFEEYRGMVLRHPDLIKNMTMELIDSGADDDRADGPAPPASPPPPVGTASAQGERAT